MLRSAMPPSSCNLRPAPAISAAHQTWSASALRRTSTSSHFPGSLSRSHHTGSAPQCDRIADWVRGLAIFVLRRRNLKEVCAKHLSRRAQTLTGQEKWLKRQRHCDSVILLGRWSLTLAPARGN